MVDVFTLKAFNWADDPDDLPLAYAFAAGIDGARNELSAPSLSERFQARLTAGVPLELHVTVVDQHDAMAYASTQANVTASELDEVVVELVVSEAAVRLQTGDGQAATQSAAALAASLNVKQQHANLAAAEAPEIRASFAALGDQVGTALRTTLMTTVARAAEMSAVSPVGLKQTSSAVQAISSEWTQLSDQAVAEGAVLLARLASEAVTMSESLEQGTEVHLLQSVDAMLHAPNASRGSPASRTAVRQLAAAVSTMPLAMLRGRVPGEGVQRIATEHVQMVVAKEEAAELDASDVRFSAPVGTGGRSNATGSFTMPNGTLAALLSAPMVAEGAGVGVALTMWSVDIHAGEIVTGKGEGEGEEQSEEEVVKGAATPIVSIVLSDDGGVPLIVDNLAKPMVIEVPAPWTPTAVPGNLNMPLIATNRGASSVEARGHDRKGMRVLMPWPSMALAWLSWLFFTWPDMT